MAKIVLFEHDHYGGRWLVLTEAASDLEKRNFGDITSSLIVLDGSWELCTDKDYQGKSAFVDTESGPQGVGLYPTPDDFKVKGDWISSVRPAKS